MKPSQLIENNYLMSILPESIPTFWKVVNSEDDKESAQLITKLIDKFRDLELLKDSRVADDESVYYTIGDNLILVMGPVNVIIAHPDVQLENILHDMA